MKTFKDFLAEQKQLDEATWVVTFKKGTYGGVRVHSDEIEVNARSAREAITRAAKSEFGLDKTTALTIDSDVKPK